MSNAVTALALGVGFEKLTDLEKQHDENRFRKLCLCPREEANTKRTDGGNRHEEMFVKCFTMCQTLCGFLECVESDEQVGYQIDEKHLPCGQVIAFLDDDCANQQNHRGGNLDDLLFQTTFVVVLVVMCMFTTLVVVMFMMMLV